MNATPETRDEVIEAVHAVREAYAARFNYDLGALFRHARERASQQGNREVVRRQPKPVEEITEVP